MLTQLPREQKRDGGGREFWLKQLGASGSGVMTAPLNDNGCQKGRGHVPYAPSTGLVPKYTAALFVFTVLMRACFNRYH